MNQTSDVSDPVSCASEVSAIEIDEVQRGWSLRGRGRDMVFGDASYMRARVEPLAARLGVEPGLLLIGPMLARWP
jgi:hypothetical protein